MTERKIKNILIIASNTIHVLNYINLIKDEFDKVQLITNSENKNFDYGNVEIFRADFSLRNPISFLKNIFKIRKIIKCNNPDVIHVHQLGTVSLLSLLANKSTKIPTVYTAWGSDVLYVPKINFLYKAMLVYILKRGAFFTSDSVFMAEEMRRLAKKNLDVLIANFGINIDDLMIAEKQNLIYSNRQLKKLYRIDLIIKAFAQFVNNNHSEDWKLIIGGEGEDKDVLVSLVKELNILDKVEFVGWLDKKMNSYYYCISRFYISIPESDATSISLLEAMAAGCIPIVSDLPANREWINHGQNGIVVNDMINDFISKAKEINYSKAKEINRKLILEHGTKDANKAKFISYYKRVINEQ